jgi:Holliday junction resolvasome RuvABC endonuclease subunit
MVGRLLQTDAVLSADEADALGAAICHVHTSRFALHAALPGANGRRRWRRAAGRR